jgi:hypothetical protein
MLPQGSSAGRAPMPLPPDGRRSFSQGPGSHGNYYYNS